MKPTPFAERYPDLASGGEFNTIDFFYGTIRRRWPALGLHAWVQEASYGKGRLMAGPIDSFGAGGTY